MLDHTQAHGCLLFLGKLREAILLPAGVVVSSFAGGV